LSRGAKIGVWAGGGGLVAVIAVVALVFAVVSPNKRAESANASESARARAEQSRLADELEAAKQAFAAVTAACAEANKSLGAAIDKAKITVQTDPATLQNTSLIETLNTQISQAEGVADCQPPTMADDLDGIGRQTLDLEAAAAVVVAAVDALVQADQAVAASAQAKLRAEAARREQEERAALEAAISPKNVFSLLFTDANGYMLDANIQLSDWIKGSESDMLQAAWEKVGGKGDMPITEGEYDDYHLLDPNQAAYVFGTVSFSNRTPDYPAKNFNDGYFSLDMTPYYTMSDWNVVQPSSELGMPAMVVTQYGTKIESNSLQVSYSITLVRPDLQTNSWGPVPFVFAVDKVFTPNYPDGNPDLDKLFFYVEQDYRSTVADHEQLHVGRTW
jgi:hypothetical protein